MTTRVAEGLEGARQEMLVHLFCASFVAKAHAYAPLIISEEKERLLAVFESMEEKNLSMNVISNNNKTENYHLTTFTFIFTFSNAINFLCFLNIGTQRKLRIKLC